MAHALVQTSQPPVFSSGFRTYDLAVEFAKICRQIKLPPDLKYQLDRASSSIALNLKEGSARRSEKERHQFYRIALGSFRECEAIFDIHPASEPELNGLLSRLGGSLYRLCRATQPQQK